MANGHLTYKPATGHLAYSVNGHLALNCVGESPCYDQECDTEGLGDAVVTTDCEADCDCVSDTFTYQTYVPDNHQWSWRGGSCMIYGMFEIDFTLELTCQEDGTWLVKILAMWVVADYVFSGTFPASAIQCVGGAFTGTVELAGLDASQGGTSPLPDCTGCTATVTF